MIVNVQNSRCFVVVDHYVGSDSIGAELDFGELACFTLVGELLGSMQGIGLLISIAQGSFNASDLFAAYLTMRRFFVCYLSKKRVQFNPDRVAHVALAQRLVERCGQSLLQHVAGIIR